jgi:outer membrane protein OmpA-like peptidoglycan-associated protein
MPGDSIVKKALMLVVLAAVAHAAAAQEAAPPQDEPAGPIRPGWYVAPMALYLKPDSGRCNVDADFGGAAAFGHRGSFASLELWAQVLKLPHDGCTYTVPAPTDVDPQARATVNEPAGEAGLNAFGLALMAGPFFADEVLARFFGVVGFGVIQRKDHPHYSEDDSTIFGDVGLGYLHPVRLFGRDAAARVELRYRYDAQQPPHPDDHDPAPPHAYGDLVLQAGLQFALSRAASPPVAEAVAVVEVADADGDGVGDDADTCPGTLAGTSVDAAGCEPPPEVPPPPPAEPTIETAKAGDTIVLKGVNFETGRSTLTANAKTLLDGVAQQLTQRSDLKVEIGGHTDARGNEAYNQSLSEQRAQASPARASMPRCSAPSATAKRSRSTATKPTKGASATAASS